MTTLHDVLGHRAPLGAFVAIAVVFAMTSGCGMGAMYPHTASGNTRVGPKARPGERTKAKWCAPEKRYDFGVVLAPRFGYENVKIAERGGFDGPSMGLEGEVHIPIGSYVGVGMGVGFQTVTSSESSAATETKAASVFGRTTTSVFAQASPAYPFVLRAGYGGSLYGSARHRGENLRYERAQFAEAGGGVTFPIESNQGDVLMLVEWRRSWGEVVASDQTTLSLRSDAFLVMGAFVAW